MSGVSTMLALVLVTSTATVAPAAAAGTACATMFAPSAPSGSPKVITTENELVWITADSSRGAHDYVQSADLDLNGCVWTPIANFTGSYDGGGHRIRHLAVTPTSAQNRVGFIARAVGASVTNLTLDSVTVTNSLQMAGALAAEMVNSTLSAITVTGIDVGEPANATDEVGGIVGKFETNFSVDVTASMLRSDGIVRGRNYVGGVFGNLYVDSGTISVEDVTVAADVDALRTAGGFAGVLQVNTGTFAISDVTTSGTVTSSASSGSSTVGGAVGYVYGPRSSMHRIVSTGDVTATDTYAGGLIGYVAGLELHRSSASGSVTGTDYLGGLVGYVETAGAVTLSAVSASGSVTGDDDVGGLLGYLDAYSDSATICDAAATGSVSGVDKVAGLIARIVDSGTFAAIDRAYASGSLTGSTRVGGAVGVASGGVTTSGIVWNLDASGVTVSATEATGLSTAAMTTRSTYSDRAWSIAATSDPRVAAGGVTWSITEGVSTPSLVPGALTAPGSPGPRTSAASGPVSSGTPPPPPPTTTAPTSTTSTPPTSTSPTPTTPLPVTSVPDVGTEIEIEVVNDRVLDVTHGDARLEVTAVSDVSGLATPLDARGRLVVTGERLVRVRGTGFAPSSTLEVTMGSTSRPLGSVAVDIEGTFDATVQIPADVEPGDHVLEGRGQRSDGARISVSLPMVLTASVTLPSTGSTVPVGGVILVIMGVVVILAGRRRRPLM